jgi:hypothetical protein
MKWTSLKHCKLRLHAAETTSTQAAKPIDMASFCANDDILINYSNLMKNMNYVDCSRFVNEDIKCTSSPRISNVKRCQSKKIHLNVKVCSAGFLGEFFFLSRLYSILFDFKKFRKHLADKVKQIHAYMQGSCDVSDDLKKCKLVNFNYKPTISDVDAKHVKEQLRKLRTSMNIEKKRRRPNETHDDLLFPNAINLFYNRTSSPVSAKRLSRLSFITNTEFTSTPIDIDPYDLDNESTFFCRTLNTDGDESTQVQADAPVLLESTFNTSSCSNIDDDLIILKHAFKSDERVAASHTNANSILINKYHDDTYASFTDIPSWANGKQ